MEAGSGSMTRGPTPSFLIGPISCRRAWPRRPALGATKTTRRPRICMGKTKNVLAAAKRLVRTARTLGRLWFGRRAHRRPVGALKLAPSPPRGAPPGATRAAQVVPRRRRLGAWALGGPVPVTPGPSAPVRAMCRGVRPRAHGRVPTAGLGDAVRVLRVFCASAYARARTGGSRRRAWILWRSLRYLRPWPVSAIGLGPLARGRATSPESPQKIKVRGQGRACTPRRACEWEREWESSRDHGCVPV